MTLYEQNKKTSSCVIQGKQFQVHSLREKHTHIKDESKGDKYPEKLVPMQKTWSHISCQLITFFFLKDNIVNVNHCFNCTI